MLSPKDINTRDHDHEQILLLQKPKIFNFNGPRIRRTTNYIHQQEPSYTPSNATSNTKFSYFHFASYFNKREKEEAPLNNYEQHCNIMDINDDDGTTVYSNSSYRSKYLPSYFQCKDILRTTSIMSPTSNVDDKDEYYIDDHNDLSYLCCQYGTKDTHGIWLNSKDTPGLALSSLVWLLILYSGITITLLAEERKEPPFIAIVYCTLCMLSLASHAKTTLTDPGAVPESAVPPSYTEINLNKPYNMCSRCQTYKPDKSHHCRICDRCISRMDHHCPWMNNCIGAGNFKHFVLFLIYTWSSSVFALLYFFIHYFFCVDEECAYSNALVPLVKFMSFFCLCALLFTSTMIMNVIYGLMTGLGTVDRLKLKSNGAFNEADDEPVLFKDVFGVGPWYWYFFPVDPVFEDYDRVMGYCTTQRLLREEHYYYENSVV